MIMACEQLRLAAHKPSGKITTLGEAHTSTFYPTKTDEVFFGGFGGIPPPSANTAVVLATKSNTANMNRIVFIVSPLPILIYSAGTSCIGLSIARRNALS